MEVKQLINKWWMRQRRNHKRNEKKILALNENKTTMKPLGPIKNSSMEEIYSSMWLH